MSGILQQTWFWYTVIGIFVGFLAVIIMTISEGKPNDPIDGIATVIFAAVLWPLALAVCLAWIVSKTGIALGLRLKNKWGHLL